MRREDGEKDMLQIAPPLFDVDEAAAIAGQIFAFPAVARKLTGERDLNFLLADATGKKRVLKIANAGERAPTLDFQLAALDHLAQTGFAPFVPGVLRSKGGDALVDVEDRLGRRHHAYMLDYIDGTPLASGDRAPVVGDCERIGALLGELDRALQGFRHPAQRRRLQWDISLAAELRPWLCAVEDDSLALLARGALDRFEAEVLPHLDVLPRQVIHNDLNPHNLILAGTTPFAIASIIDFGDMLEAPRANDVAVAASYHFDRGLEAPAALIAGYWKVLPLTQQELSAVPLLIAARAVLTVAITSWRARLYPENRAYIQRNLPAAARTLAALSGDGCRRFSDTIATFCRQDF